MTRTESRRRAIFGLVTTALLVVTLPTLSFAQRSGRRPGGVEGAGAAPPYQPSRLESLERNLKLNKDQKKAVKLILDDAHKNAAPIREGLTRTRSAIVAAIQANGTQTEIDAAVDSYAEQSATMTLLEMQAFAQVLQALDPDQRANVDGGRSAFYLMRGMFLDSKNWNAVPDFRLY